MAGYYYRFGYLQLAERVGFEPTAPCGVTSFQDWLLKPLGHLSMSGFKVTKSMDYLSTLFSLCQ